LERLPAATARAYVESGDDTLFIGWLRTSLPDLKQRLDTAARNAADEEARLHFSDMAVQVGRLYKAAE
jgi:hypothetical protein